MKSEGKSQKSESCNRPLRCVVALSLAFCVFSGAIASAAPRQDEVFRSIQDNLGERTDPTKFVAVLCVGVAVVLLVVVANRWRKRQDRPRAINHHGRLTRELSKQVNLKPAEMRQLKLLAEQQQVENPMTLLLCPSLLVKAAKQNPDKLDRKVVANLLRRVAE